MNQSLAKNDLAFLVADIVSPPEQQLLLRSSLELALLRLGHDQRAITQALDEYYQTMRTLH